MRKFFYFLPLAAFIFLCSCTKDEAEATTVDVNPGGSTTTLTDPALAWSSTSVTAVLGQAVTFPILTNKYNVSVTYSSSNTGVATITSDGTVTIVAVGAATITAASAATDTYSAGSASYTITVTDGQDSGAGTFKYASTGDPESDDDISNTTFTRMVTVTYASGGATVSGLPTSGITASVSGNNVTLTNTADENVVYKLTGTASDGFFKLYSSKKQAILLDGVSLTCSSGAAINNQSKKRTFVMVEGKNTLADGSSAAYSSGDEDMKAVFFSEGQLVFSGTGSLTLTANNKQSKSGIVSDDYVRFMNNPTVSVTAGSSAGHGVRGKDCVQITGGNLSVNTSAAMKKAIGSDDFVLVEGGTTDITVTGGVAYDSEDKEYTGSAGIKADNYFAMTGGTVTIKNTGNGGKGISAGSYDYNETTHAVDDSYITGGTLTITTSGSEVNDVSAKGMKIGWVTKNGSGDRATVTGNAGNLKINGGKVIINCTKCEGMEAKGNMTFVGGEVYVYSNADDAVNCQGEMNVNGGYLYAYSSGNDALDANHDLKLNGGYVFAVTSKGSPEVAIDANTEGGYKLYINSGVTMVAYGGLERNYSASQKVYSMSATAGKWNALYGSNAFIAAFKTPSGASSLAVSAPSLSKGYKDVSVSSPLCNGIWAVSGISGGTSVSLGTYNNNGGGGGPR